MPGSLGSNERNQISVPFGFQHSDAFSPVVFCPETAPNEVFLPPRSTTVIPMAVPLVRVTYATRSPSGNTRIIHSGQPILSASTVPIGYSSRLTPLTRRNTAIDEPSGAQSAASTPSSDGRVCPPEIEVRTNLPVP